MNKFIRYIVYVVGYACGYIADAMERTQDEEPTEANDCSGNPRLPNIDDLVAILPYANPTTSAERDAQNTVALVWFATYMDDTLGSLAQQVKRHEDLNT